MFPPALSRHFFLVILALCGVAGVAFGQGDAAPIDLVISVADQKMVVLREGGFLKKYKISTSRFGLGDNLGSYKTPLGQLRVWEKVGGDLPSGAVIKHRTATGEILAANAPGRDPIVSRILWLEGLEAQNDNARGRGIYIHGTPEEINLGKPVSWGCIRMRSEDVIELFDLVPVGTMVRIAEESLPHFPKWKPASEVIIASKSTPATAPLSQKAPRLVPERVSILSELSAAKGTRMTAADPGAAGAFRGSILMAGISVTPKISAKVPVPAVKPPAAKERAAIWERFALATPLQAQDSFSLEMTLAHLPVGLLDLRRVALAPLLVSAGILDAPILPALAVLDRSLPARPLF